MLRNQEDESYCPQYLPHEIQILLIPSITTELLVSLNRLRVLEVSI